MEALWQRLIDIQCRKPPEVGTTTAEVLNELGLEERAAQLRGWLVCQSYIIYMLVCILHTLYVLL